MPISPANSVAWNAFKTIETSQIRTTDNQPDPFLFIFISSLIISSSTRRRFCPPRRFGYHAATGAFPSPPPVRVPSLLSLIHKVQLSHFLAIRSLVDFCVEFCELTCSRTVSLVICKRESLAGLEPTTSTSTATTRLAFEPPGTPAVSLWREILRRNSPPARAYYTIPVGRSDGSPNNSENEEIPYKVIFAGEERPPANMFLLTVLYLNLPKLSLKTFESQSSNTTLDANLSIVVRGESGARERWWKVAFWCSFARGEIVKLQDHVFQSYMLGQGKRPQTGFRAEAPIFV